MAQLGIVTYNIAKDWDLDTIFKKLEALGYEGVELRTTHAHKVEVNLTKARREEIRKRFEDSVVQIAGLGSTFEYQATDPDLVRSNIEGTKEYVRLAHDIGAPGVKVRPNGIPKGADHPNVYACWNSNPTDVKNGTIKDTFALVADRIQEVHLRDLTDEAYPWRELFALLKAQKYEGFTLAEIPESRDPDRVLKYFRALWMAYQPST
jgi:sugar phosphate isomerase/epimerase